MSTKLSPHFLILLSQTVLWILTPFHCHALLSQETTEGHYVLTYETSHFFVQNNKNLIKIYIYSFWKSVNRRIILLVCLSSKLEEIKNFIHIYLKGRVGNNECYQKVRNKLAFEDGQVGLGRRMAGKAVSNDYTW